MGSNACTCGILSTRQVLIDNDTDTNITLRSADGNTINGYFFKAGTTGSFLNDAEAGDLGIQSTNSNPSATIMFGFSGEHSVLSVNRAGHVGLNQIPGTNAFEIIGTQKIETPTGDATLQIKSGTSGSAAIYLDGGSSTRCTISQSSSGSFAIDNGTRAITLTGSIGLPAPSSSTTVHMTYAQDGTHYADFNWANTNAYCSIQRIGSWIFMNAYLPWTSKGTFVDTDPVTLRGFYPWTRPHVLTIYVDLAFEPGSRVFAQAVPGVNGDITIYWSAGASSWIPLTAVNLPTAGIIELSGLFFE